MTIDAPDIDMSFAEPADADQLERAAKALRGNGFTVDIVDTVAEARARVRDLLPRDQGIFTANSQTLQLSGIAADIEESADFESVRRRAAQLGDDFAAQLKLGAAPDVVVGSVHAITEQGQMVAASATGSQLASYAAGALRAIWIVGAQKVVPDFDTSLRRVRSYSLPLEWRRSRQATGQPSFIGKILIFEREALPDRATVILVREAIGF